ncbi:SIR2 family protein [Globicatella sulfidifaciens]
MVRVIIEVLNISNLRQTPKSANIFTTNYDLFLEKAVDRLLLNSNFVFNDRAKGYFKRELDSSNYNQVVSYKGLNDNYISEIPSISLIKPHGSVNWQEDLGKINIYSYVDEVLYYFRNRDSFSDFQDGDLKDYVKFKGILIDFRAFYGLDKFSLKQIDQYVWQLGKDYFPKNYGKKKRGDKYFVFNR